MSLQIDHSVAEDFETEHYEVAEPKNWERGEDLLIAGAVSEWVLTGLQSWRKQVRNLRRDDLSPRDAR